MPEDGHDRSQDLILLERAILHSGSESPRVMRDRRFWRPACGLQSLVAITQHDLAGPQFRTSRRRTVRMSPGHTEGSMLVPVTLRRTSPNWRTTCAARSRFAVF